MSAIFKRVTMPSFTKADTYLHQSDPEAWIEHHVALAKANNQPHSLAIAIDPPLATALLKRNPVHWNRKMSEPSVAKWADVMRSGDWQLNGESIIVAATGELNDGQHRLQACIDSGATFRTMVCFGVERDTRDTLDQGKRRSIRDTLQMHGFKYTNNLGSAVTAAYGYVKRDMQALAESRITPQQVFTFIEDHKTILDEENMTTGVRMQKIFHVSPSTFAACYFLLSGTRNNRLIARKFFDSMIFGLGFDRKSDPRLRLIERLRDHGTKARRLDRAEMLCISIKAWNLFVKGEDCNRLRWRGPGHEEEEMPDIVDVTDHRTTSLLKQMEWK